MLRQFFSDYGNGENINIAKAAYFPWYRFVTEPVEFFKIEDVSTYVLKAIYYLTKKSKVLIANSLRVEIFLK